MMMNCMLNTMKMPINIYHICKIIPYWRNYKYWETPFNWYLSYGSMLLYLHQISNSKYYENPYYNSPDATLKEYYRLIVEDMASNFFQDFQNWNYSGVGWNNTPFPLNKGLCYYPEKNSYLWRYFDYTSSMNFWGYNSKNEYQGIASDMQFELDKWYKIDIKFELDSVKIEFYDNDGVTLISQFSSEWENTNSLSDLIIGKRVDSDEYFNGVIDEVKLYSENDQIAFWKMEGNAADSSANNINGTIFGSPETVEGKIGLALKFKTGDYISFPKNTAFENINRFHYG